MIPIPCFNALKIPRLVEALQAEDYEAYPGIARVLVEPKTKPITPQELMNLQRLLGRVLNEPGQEVHHG